jgi:hypothetical protein
VKTADTHAEQLDEFRTSAEASQNGRYMPDPLEIDFLFAQVRTLLALSTGAGPDFEAAEALIAVQPGHMRSRAKLQLAYLYALRCPRA